MTSSPGFPHVPLLPTLPRASQAAPRVPAASVPFRSARYPLLAVLAFAVVVAAGLVAFSSSAARPALHSPKFHNISPANPSMHLRATRMLIASPLGAFGNGLSWNRSYRPPESIQRFISRCQQTIDAPA